MRKEKNKRSYFTALQRLTSTCVSKNRIQLHDRAVDKNQGGALPYFLKRSGYGKKMGWQKDVPLKHALMILQPMEPRFAQQNLPIRRDPSSRKRWGVPFSKLTLGTGFAGLGKETVISWVSLIFRLP
jgi:hypothetical protein